MDLSVYILFGYYAVMALEGRGRLNLKSPEGLTAAKELVQGIILPFFSSHQKEFLSTLLASNDPYRRASQWSHYGFCAHAYVYLAILNYPDADDIESRLFRVHQYEIDWCHRVAPDSLPDSPFFYLRDKWYEEGWLDYLKLSVNTCPCQHPCPTRDLEAMIASIQQAATDFVTHDAEEVFGIRQAPSN